MIKHDEHNKKVIGERLNTLLAVKGLKQKDIADLLGVTENTVSYYVTGARCPNTDQIIAIAKKWNVSADYLLGLSEVMSTDQNKKIACEVTGLTEENVEFLEIAAQYKEKFYTLSEESKIEIVHRRQGEHFVIDTINIILSHLNLTNSFLEMIGYCILLSKTLSAEDYGPNTMEEISNKIESDFPDAFNFIEQSGGFILSKEKYVNHLQDKLSSYASLFLNTLIDGYGHDTHAIKYYKTFFDHDDSCSLIYAEEMAEWGKGEQNANDHTEERDI